MKGLRKGISAVLAAALVLTAMPVNGNNQVYAAGETAKAADVNVSIQPGDASKFNDTNQDGWGEFEGWGTSLCWWANRLGYDTKLTKAAADAFFSADGLNMNIGRYNIGGGDDVYELPEITPNEKAKVYGVEGDKAPQFGGSKMKVENNDKLKNAAYKVSDADFGFTQGKTVGSLRQIGYVNELGAPDGDGGNLRYTVNVPSAGKYTIKMLWSLEGDNTRAAAIRLNNAVTDGDAAQDIVIGAAEVNRNEIAVAGSMHLFLVKFSDVQLNAGNNLIAIGGKGGTVTGGETWGMNFVKMLVVKSGEEGTLPEEPKGEFKHPAHITRSDSAVPGYCVNVTKIMADTDTSKFDRADEECGYAWDYDWDADKNQMNILKAAINANEGFLTEAFSNSPPYFMTNSGCSSGSEGANGDNLRADSYGAFAKYMADVIEHWTKEGITFQSASPMNEPDPSTKYWGSNSNKQEGCHFTPGTSQSKVIKELNKELKKKAEAETDANVKAALNNIILSGTDETSIDLTISSYNALDSETKETIERIDTHTYGGSKRSELRALAEKENKNLWMSEVDGAYTAGSNAGEMTAALGFAQRIMTDLNGMKASAWILWNAVDSHVDANNGEEKWPFGNDFTSTDGLFEKVDLNKGYWGLAVGDHNEKKLILTKKYEAFGQFSRYIRPGYTLISSDNSNTLAAWDREGKKLVVVAVNTLGSDKTWKFDLSRFSTLDATKLGNVKAYRTSGSMEEGEKWADVSTQVHAAADAGSKSVTVDMKANSITTFIIDGVEDYDEDQDYLEAEGSIRQELLKQNDSFIEQNMEEIPLNADMVTGSKPWTDKNGNVSKDVVTNVVDGKFDTFFDGVNDGWVKIDMGQQQNIVAVAYAPRKSYASRCVGASFYGSNDGENWTRLYTITSTPPEGKCTNAYATAFETSDTKYRYIKYAVPEGDSNANCNVAEIKLYRLKEGVSLPEIDIPQTLQEWVTYYRNKTEGKTYSVSSQAALDEAFEAAQQATDAVSQNKARKLLAEAYLGLEEIVEYNSFSGVEGAVIRDNNGKVIQAHGGQIQQLTVNGKTKWYWIGEDKTNDYRPCPGIHMYTSEDLYNWTDEGVVLKTAKTYEEFKTDKYFTDLYGDLKTEDEKKAIFTDIWQGSNSNEGCVIERPKMLYNDKTGKYVIWFHADGQDPFAESAGGNYAKAKAGVAIADSPTGPYKLLGSYLLNTNKRADHGFDSEGGHVRDMNLFKDDDGTAYVMYSSDGNKTMHIARLNDEYTNVAKNQKDAVEGVDFTRNFINSSREAPAMFKYNNKYYLMTSGCTGWSPNQAQYAVADHPLGPWTVKGDPCTDTGSGTTYDTQSTCIFPVDAANGKFIYMGDRWSNPDEGNALRDSRYVWLPVEFQTGNKMVIKRYSNWKLEDDVFKRNSDKTELYALLGEAAKLDQKLYTTASWKEYSRVLSDVERVQVNISASQTMVDEAKVKLEGAIGGLKTFKQYLVEEIAANSVKEADKNNYTDDSWNIYETIRKDVLDLQNKEDLNEEQVEDAIKELKDAVSVLELKDKTGSGSGSEPGLKEQNISYTKEYKKVYGNKAFTLNARLTSGDGTLSYISSDKNIATVDGAGKVTIKGTGKCTITITASATKSYKEKKVSVTLTVKPKKAAVSSAKPVKGRKLKVAWKKDAKATGYEIQCSLKKDFKKIAAKTTVKKAGTTSVTLKKLTKGKKYYVRVRAYKSVKDGKKTTKIYGDWSKAKLSGKIKK